MLQSVRMGLLAATAVTLAAGVSTAQAAWEPNRPVETVVPAGRGGQVAPTVNNPAFNQSFMTRDEFAKWVGAEA